MFSKYLNIDKKQFMQIRAKRFSSLLDIKQGFRHFLKIK